MKKILPFYTLPAIFSLAWPTMLEQLLQTAVQYIDTAMVGSLGTGAVAAVGSTTTVGWLVGSTISAAGVGFLAFISQALGAGDELKARRASAQAVSAVLFLGVLFTALTLSLSPFVPVWMQVDPAVRSLSSTYFFILYAPMLPRCASIIFGTVLRAAGDSKTPMLTGVIVNAINVVLNFILIFPSRRVSLLGVKIFLPGADLGVVGAAIASAAAFTVGGVLITVVLLRHRRISPQGQSIRPDGEILRPCLRVAVPNALQRFATSFGYVVFAASINHLGEVSTAAHTVANTVESAFYIPGYGMQSAAATLAGNAKGARSETLFRDTSKMIILSETVLMILSGAVLFAFAPQMASLFTSDAEVIRLGSIVLRLVALSEPFYGVSIVIEGMMQGTGHTTLPFIVNILGMWGIRIVGTVICIFLLGMGLVSAWACMIIHNLMLFAVFSIYYVKGNMVDAP